MCSLTDLRMMEQQDELPTARSMAPAVPRRPRRGSPTVLVGFADAMAAIETAWSLQAAGFRVVALRRAGTRPPLRHVPGVELHEVPAPEHDVSATVRGAARLIRQHEPVAIMPLDDASIWVFNQLEELGAPVAGPTGLAADFALDKSLQVAAARQAGLHVPPTQILQDPREADRIEYPVIVKAARPLSQVGGGLVRPTAVVCAHSEELEAAAARPWHGPVLVQPLIAGTGEGLFGHAGHGGVVGWSSHRRVRMINPQGSGSSACRSHEVDQRLIGPSERFLESVAWRGMFMLEFLRDASGIPWFMELNGRAWGSMALARRRGFEYPSWTVRAALAPSFAPQIPNRPPHMTCRNFALDLVHLLFVARGPQSDAPVQWPRLGTSIRDVFGPQREGSLYNWNPAQPDVFLADTFATLGAYVRKMTRSRG